MTLTVPSKMTGCRLRERVVARVLLPALLRVLLRVLLRAFLPAFLPVLLPASVRPCGDSHPHVLDGRSPHEKAAWKGLSTPARSLARDSCKPACRNTMDRPRCTF